MYQVGCYFSCLGTLNPEKERQDLGGKGLLLFLPGTQVTYLYHEAVDIWGGKSQLLQSLVVRELVSKICQSIKRAKLPLGS